jgi:hypothetical protein
MTGTRARFNQNRDLHLLAELGTTLRIMDRFQAMAVGGFRSTTRVNTRLGAYTKAGLTNRVFIATENGGKKALYFLSRKGALLAGVPHKPLKRTREEMLIADLFVEHQLAVNSIYIAVAHQSIPMAGVGHRIWQTTEEPISRSHPIIPDAYFEMDSLQGIQSMFLEVDMGTEVLKIWQKKTAAYIRFAMSGDFPARFHQSRFRVLVITRSEHRLESVRKTVSELTDKIFYFTTFELIKRDGFWSPIWRRPQADQWQSLL